MPDKNAAFKPLVIDEDIRELIIQALTEDIRDGDATTIATIVEGTQAKAAVTAKERGVVCGLPVFAEVFSLLDHGLQVKELIPEGSRVDANTPVAEVDGSLPSILKGERVALNFLGMMSGIATQTAAYVEAVKHTHCRITDTRKTIPLMRALQKYAVRVGGGVNHRFGLYDMVLIKDNHIDGSGGVAQAVKRAQDRWQGDLTIECETRNLEEVTEALQAGADRIMLDNMSLDEMKQAVKRIGGRAETEASGGVTLGTVADIAETGVDLISVGALTHSFRCMDFSMRLSGG